MYRKLMALTLAFVLATTCSILDAQEHSGMSELRQAWLKAFTEDAEKQAAFAGLEDNDARKRRTLERQQAVIASTVPFLEPQEIRSINGFFSVTLDVDYGEFAIGPHQVRLRTYNGSLVGPTFKVKPGDVLEIKLRNHLPDEPEHLGNHNDLHGFNTTNLHTHGLHVSPKGRADNILLRIGPGEEFDYRIEIPEDHPAGTFWYHAHKHGAVAAQVSSGMSGTIIIEGGLDDVPEIKNAEDRTFLFQQIPYVLEHGIGVVEERHAALSFGPRTWDALGRHTTINGQLFPTFSITEGALERWRFIQSGVREGMGLRLVGVSGNAAGKVIPLKQIAWDGLPIGKAVESPEEIVELFPGYRVDVLVKLPKTGFDGVYLLEDAAITPTVSGSTQNAAFHPKYLAKVTVDASDDAIDMPEPTDNQLATVKQAVRLLDDLSKVKDVGTQEATYSIDPVPGGVTFSIDGRPYSEDEENIRRLKLGTVDEWTLKAQNGVGPVDHPFHIHVNPFQIIKVVDTDGKEYPEMLGWRDTLLLRDGWTYTTRTKYQRYTGQFVQHCHILDHEDQGMMELIEIYRDTQPPAKKKRAKSKNGQAKAPPIELQDPIGRMVNWDFATSPTLVIFFRGAGCLHCQEQLSWFTQNASELTSDKIRMLAISTDPVSELANQVELLPQGSPFAFLSDQTGASSKAYGCFGESMHGAFLIDREGSIVWEHIGRRPFTNVSAVSRIGKELR